MACTIVWGNVAEWFAGVGTVAAFGLGLFLYAQQLKDRRRDQASKVHVLTARNESFTLDDGNHAHIKYTVSNQSDLPAYEGIVAFLPWDATIATASIRTQSFESMLPRHVTDPYEMPADEMLERSLLLGTDRVMRAPMSIEFTDASGRRWKRMPNGRLYRESGRHRKQWKRER